MPGHLDTTSECPVIWIQRQNARSFGYSVRMSDHLDTASECLVIWINRQNVRPLGYSVRMSVDVGSEFDSPVTSEQSLLHVRGVPASYVGSQTCYPD
jgi:hypothetical protein